MATLEKGGAAKCRPTTSTAHVPRTAHHQRADRLARRFTVVSRLPTAPSEETVGGVRGCPVCPPAKALELVADCAFLGGDRGVRGDGMSGRTHRFTGLRVGAGLAAGALVGSLLGVVAAGPAFAA